MARAAIPMLALAWFLIGEALGIMPAGFSRWSNSSKAPGLKYLLVAFAIVWYAWTAGGVTERVKTFLRRKFSREAVGAAS